MPEVINYKLRPNQYFVRGANFIHGPGEILPEHYVDHDGNLHKRLKEKRPGGKMFDETVELVNVPAERLKPADAKTEDDPIPKLESTLAELMEEKKAYSESNKSLVKQNDAQTQQLALLTQKLGELTAKLTTIADQAEAQKKRNDDLEKKLKDLSEAKKDAPKPSSAPVG